MLIQVLVVRKMAQISDSEVVRAVVQECKLCLTYTYVHMYIYSSMTVT